MVSIIVHQSAVRVRPGASMDLWGILLWLCLKKIYRRTSWLILGEGQNNRKHWKNPISIIKADRFIKLMLTQRLTLCNSITIGSKLIRIFLYQIHTQWNLYWRRWTEMISTSCDNLESHTELFMNIYTRIRHPLINEENQSDQETQDVSQKWDIKFPENFHHRKTLYGIYWYFFYFISFQLA